LLNINHTNLGVSNIAFSFLDLSLTWSAGHGGS